MPEPASLDDRLAIGRTELFADIDQPPMDRLGRRAATLRRRRRAATAAGSLAAFLMVGTIAVQPWLRATGTPAPVAGVLPSGGPIYSGGGITVNGLVDPRSVVKLAGTIADVEFTDADHGFLVTACQRDATGCQPAFASTTDGGLTWTLRPPPPLPASAVANILTFPDNVLALDIGDENLTLTSGDAGQEWTVLGRSRPSVRQAAPGEVLHVHTIGDACADGPVEVWGPEGGLLGTLLAQPDLDVCQVERVTAADNTWWASGTFDGQPAVATTTDGGLNWTRQILPGAGTARLASFGLRVYAVVTGADAALRAIYYAPRGGTLTEVAASGLRPPTVVGEPISLPDGRLLIASAGRWYVSQDNGASFTRIEGKEVNLPWIGKFARTPAGYVAYNLFQAGWAAFSSDGATWRKFPVH